MTLPVFDSADAIPEPFRPFYREDAGKFVPDLVPGADVVGLKRKNAELLATTADLKARYADVDPEEYRTLKATGGKVKDLDARLTAAAQKEAELTAQNAALAARLKGNAKRVEVTSALAAAGASIDLLEPLVSQRVDVEEQDGREFVIVRNADGSVRYRDGAGNRFTVADLLTEMRADPKYQPAFNVSVGSGGGAMQSAGGGARVLQMPDSRTLSDNLDDIASGKVRIAS